jgi:hypothetical protein
MSGSILRSTVAAWRAHARGVDYLVAAYVLAFALGVVVFGRDTAHWEIRAAGHFALLGAIVLVVAVWGRRERGIIGFVRHCYPGLLYPFFYGQTGAAIHWFFPAFFDHQVVAWERSLFGVDPNVWIIPAQSAALNELLMLAYSSYYLLIPAVALPLFFQGRLRALSRFLLATTTAFVISYLGFMLYPVEGPRFFLADRFAAPLTGFAFVPLVGWIMAHGAIHGGCIPSSHVAVALVVLVWSRRTLPRLTPFLAPFVFLLFVATVWGRFHYVSDVILGWGVGLIALWLTGRRLPAGCDATVFGDEMKESAPRRAPSVVGH